MQSATPLLRTEKGRTFASVALTCLSTSPASKRLTFVGTNNYQAGQTGGEILTTELKGKGNVVVFTIPGQANLDERLEGYKRVLARSPGIKILQVVDMAGDPTKAFDGLTSEASSDARRYARSVK